ncbi:hypothetical protein [Flagellimonas sp. 389]|uniref:hypothetical protein n=1 Tax=Flagellimonas sp. 389 TaxID=2835862 RepID=UPI001BD482B4|nr:hypothetical protein [Flagellimonas sp. 389]
MCQKPANNSSLFTFSLCLQGIITIFIFGTVGIMFSQNIEPTLPTPGTFQSYGTLQPTQPINVLSYSSSSPSNDRDRYARQMAMHEADVRKVEAEEKARKEIIEDAFTTMNGILSALPSFRNSKGSQHYRNAYAQLLPMRYNSFSPKRATFIVENAYYEGEKDYSEFEETIKKTGDFLREKLDELGLDNNSNIDKNYLLFQFFADTLEIKSKGLKHFPFEYDFDDYWGRKDWSKMFVHKLLLTGKGQCNSLPRLYLILAEEIGAVAHLALSPNHSYIKFPDDSGTWYNIELTNHMLTTDAFILNSGYVKAEAIQNKIFMHPMNKQELLSNYFAELAVGYIRKYGYDDFAEEVLNTALEIDPKNIPAQFRRLICRR